MASIDHGRRTFVTTSLSAFVASTLAQPRALASDSEFRELAARTGRAQLFKPSEAKEPTEVWCYDGMVPGPVLRYRKGETVRVRLRNALSEPTTIHWHGIRIANAMDGVPGVTQEAVGPGDTFDYEFTVPDAGTYWYHTHNKTWEQLARGLYGVLIVDEENVPEVDHDLVMVLDDWRLAQDHQIHTASFGHMHDWSHEGRWGNWVTVNGKDQPSFPVKQGERVRVRLINAANARIFNLDLSPFKAMVVALDGQPIEPHKPEGSLKLAPAQRCDLMFDCDGEAGRELALYAVTPSERVKIASLTVGEGTGSASRAPITMLPSSDLPEPDLDNAIQQELVMTGGAMGGMRSARMNGKEVDIRELARLRKLWAFNGEIAHPATPLLSVKKGQTVKLTFVNKTAFDHAMHLHGHHFKVLSRNGQSLKRTEWRDTELVPPDGLSEVAFVADNPGKWLLHCHMVEHHAAGMGTWLEVNG